MRTSILISTRAAFRGLARLACCVAMLLLSAASHADVTKLEARTWTDKKGNQLTSTFVDAKNGEVQLKNDAGELQKFKLADFSEPDQKYLRDLASYRRKLTAGEKPTLPADPALASFDIQPRQTITEPVPDMPPFRKPLIELPVRIWTDSTGKKVQGKLVTAYNDKVVIDVKGNIFDLPVTRLSPDDQQYVAVQLKGLQRDDLVTVLAKAATAAQQPTGAAPPASPAPAEVAANNPVPAAPLETQDIRARLEALKAQRGDPAPETQVAANTPTEQPLTNDDIKARLAQIRQQKGEPEPEFIPATPNPAPVYSTPQQFPAPTEITYVEPRISNPGRTAYTNMTETQRKKVHDQMAAVITRGLIRSFGSGAIPATPPNRYSPGKSPQEFAREVDARIDANRPSDPNRRCADCQGRNGMILRGQLCCLRCRIQREIDNPALVGTNHNDYDETTGLSGFSLEKSINGDTITIAVIAVIGVGILVGVIFGLRKLTAKK